MASKGGSSRNDKREVWRESIKTTHILKRLNKYVLAREDDEDYEQCKMTATQVRVANLLLDKTMPTMKAVEQTIDLSPEAMRLVVPDEMSDKEWQKRYGKKK